LARLQRTVEVGNGTMHYYSFIGIKRSSCEGCRGGVVDAVHQSLAIVLASLGPKEVNKVRLGPLVMRSVHTLRHIKDFLDVEFEIKTDDKSNGVTLLCVGSGLQNTSRKVQ
jgi:RNA 3'-terminal phosphate cyclase-like protein